MFGVMKNSVLIIGATGGVGGATARAFLKRGWTVRALNRDPERAKQRSAALGNIDWVQGDSMNQADVIRAAQGVNVLVHGANPPGYRNWKGLALPMLESSIAAARAARCRRCSISTRMRPLRVRGDCGASSATLGNASGPKL